MCIFTPLYSCKSLQSFDQRVAKNNKWQLNSNCFTHLVLKFLKKSDCLGVGHTNKMNYYFFIPKLNAWLEHYQRLLNIEFDWDPDHLSDEPTVEGPPIPVTIDMVEKAVSQMKAGKALGPSGIVIRATPYLWPGSSNHSWWQDTLWLGAEFHCLPLQGKGGCIGKGQLLRSQGDRAGHESVGEWYSEEFEWRSVFTKTQYSAPCSSSLCFKPCHKGEFQQQHLLQRLQALGAQELQWAQALNKGPWLQIYTIPGNSRPLGWQTTEGSPSRTWQAGGGSFLLLPRRHALSSRWLWTFNPNAWKLPGRSSRCCYQFSLPATSLSRHVAVCTALVYGVQCSTPVRLDHWQNQTSNFCRGMTGQWSDRIVTTRSSELLVPLGIEDLVLILKKRRLCWYGYVECSNGAVRTAFVIQVDRKRGPGKPKMTWKQLIERDCREQWKLSAIDPHDRHTWRSGVRSAIHAASQLPERGPTDVDVAPIPAC